MVVHFAFFCEGGKNVRERRAEGLSHVARDAKNELARTHLGRLEDLERAQHRLVYAHHRARVAVGSEKGETLVSGTRRRGGRQGTGELTRTLHSNWARRRVSPDDAWQRIRSHPVGRAKEAGKKISEGKATDLGEED